MTAPNNAALGQAIRRLRRAQHRTIEALGHAADVHPTYLSGIERGVRNPTWSKLCAIADTLDVPVATIARESETEAQLAAVLREARAELSLEDS